MTTKICNYVGHDASRFRELVELFLKGDSEQSRRASWPLSEAGINAPHLVKPYYARIISVLERDTLHQAVHRNVLRMLMDCEIPEKYCARLFDLCLSFAASERRDLAVRANAISVGTSIAVRFPELKNELEQMLQELGRLENSPAISVRVRKAMKELRP